MVVWVGVWVGGNGLMPGLGQIAQLGVPGMGQVGALTGMLDTAALMGAGGSMGEAAAQLMIPAVSDIIGKKGGTNSGSPMYDRKTQAPMIWIKLRKSPPIVVDREFYNISTVPGMVETAKMKLGKTPKPPAKNGPKRAPPILTDVIKKPDQPITRNGLNGVIQEPKPPMIRKGPNGSFIQQKTKVDPQMIQNGLYLSQPLRQPAQESLNIAAVEDVRTIQGVADYYRKKREIKRLNSRFNDVLRQFTLLGKDQV